MMKKIKIWLMAGTAFILLGFFLSLIGYMAGGKNYLEAADLNRLYGNATLEDKKPDAILEKTKLEDIQSIQINLEDIDFSIQASEDENYYISYQLNSRKNEIPIEYNVRDHILTIKEKKKMPSFYFIHIDIGFLFNRFQEEAIEDYQEKIIVYVPKQESLKNCEVILHDGYLEMKDFHCEETEIEIGYGDLLLAQTSFLESDIILKDGNLTIEETDFDNTEIEITYGNIKGKDCTIRDGEILLADGNIEIEKTDINNTDITLTYGDIKARNAVIENSNILLKDGSMDSRSIQFLKYNNINSQYGDIYIQIEKELLEAVTLRLETEYGDIKLPDELSGNKKKHGDMQYYERVVELTEHELNIIAEDGDISIK